MGAGGRAVAGCGVGAGCGFSASRARFTCVCGGPRLPALLRCRYARAGPGGRRVSRDAGTFSPGRHRRLPGRAAQPSAPGAASPPRPRQAPGSEVGGRAPLGLPGHLRPQHLAWPRAPGRPHRPGSPEGRSHERDVQLPPHRGHRLPVRRGLSQWLHQHSGVSEPSSGRGGAVGPGASCVRPAASCRQRTWTSPALRRGGTARLLSEKGSEMFAQVKSGAQPELSGGAPLREASTLALSPFFRRGGEAETSSAGGPCKGAGGWLGR